MRAGGGGEGPIGWVLRVAAGLRRDRAEHRRLVRLHRRCLGRYLHVLAGPPRGRPKISAPTTAPAPRGAAGTPRTPEAVWRLPLWKPSSAARQPTRAGCLQWVLTDPKRCPVWFSASHTRRFTLGALGSHDAESYSLRSGSQPKSPGDPSEPSPRRLRAASRAWTTPGPRLPNLDLPPNLRTANVKYIVGRFDIRHFSDSLSNLRTVNVKYIVGRFDIRQMSFRR